MLHCGSPQVHVANASNVHFVGLNMEYGRGWGAVFDNCNGCSIKNATLRNFGINAVNVTGGINFLLDNVSVAGTGQGGIILTGGDRQTLAPANHTIYNSNIASFSRLLQKYTPAVCLCGVGNNLIDSVVSNGPHFGMLLTGNDHTIEGNHFHTLVQSGADAGAIYSGK